MSTHIDKQEFVSSIFTYISIFIFIFGYHVQIKQMNIYFKMYALIGEGVKESYVQLHKITTCKLVI